MIVFSLIFRRFLNDFSSGMGSEWFSSGTATRRRCQVAAPDRKAPKVVANCDHLVIGQAGKSAPLDQLNLTMQILISTVAQASVPAEFL